MKLIAIGLAFSLWSCGTDTTTTLPINNPVKPQAPTQPHEAVYSVAEETQVYVDLFMTKAAEYGINIDINDLIIKFEEVEDNSDGDSYTVGYCQRGYNQTPCVVIDPDFWERASVIKRMLLVVHELGHCILERAHVNDYLSIMNPVLLDNKLFIEYEHELWAEFFDTSTFRSWNLVNIRIYGGN